VILATHESGQDGRFPDVGGGAAEFEGCGFNQHDLPFAQALGGAFIYQILRVFGRNVVERVRLPRLVVAEDLKHPFLAGYTYRAHGASQIGIANQRVRKSRPDDQHQSYIW